MTMTFKLCKKWVDSSGKGIQTSIEYTDPSGIKWVVPCIDGNEMYEEYKEWVAAGNTAEEID